MEALRKGDKCLHTICMLCFFASASLAMNPDPLIEIRLNETIKTK